MNPVERILREVVGLFERLHIPYAVMGGLAVRAHGIPRPTYDVDVTILLDRVELPKLFQAVRQLGYEVGEAYEKGWVDTVAGMPLVKAITFLEGRSLPVDIFLAETSFQDSLMSRRVCASLDGFETWLVSPEDLILLKLLSGRPRDIADVTDIVTMQIRLDEKYLRQWADDLHVRQQLEKAIHDVKD